jgi:hypothetical protein
LHESGSEQSLLDPQTPTEPEEDTKEGPPTEKLVAKWGRKFNTDRREIEIEQEKDLGKQPILENYGMRSKTFKASRNQRPPIGGSRKSNKK